MRGLDLKREAGLVARFGGAGLMAQGRDQHAPKRYGAGSRTERGSQQGLSFGMAAFHATTPDALETALREAFALDAPALIHVPVGEMPSPWDMILLPRIRGGEGRPALP